MKINAENFKEAFDEIMLPIQAMIDVMPGKGDKIEDCQKLNLRYHFQQLQAAVNGIEDCDLASDSSSVMSANLFSIINNQTKTSREKALTRLLGDANVTVCEHENVRILAWSFDPEVGSETMEKIFEEEMESDRPYFTNFSQGEFISWQGPTVNWITL